MKLGDELRQRRRAIMPPLSAKELAKQAAVSILTLQNIETGVTTNPEIETVQAIKNALEHFETLQSAARRGAPERCAVRRGRKARKKMPTKQTDEIADALEELVAAVVEANGEYSECVKRMVDEEGQWIALGGFPARPPGEALRVAIDDCRKWWVEPAAPVTPNQLATVRRSRLYFQALEGKK